MFHITINTRQLQPFCWPNRYASFDMKLKKIVSILLKTNTFLVFILFIVGCPANVETTYKLVDPSKPIVNGGYYYDTLSEEDRHIVKYYGNQHVNIEKALEFWNRAANDLCKSNYIIEWVRANTHNGEVDIQVPVPIVIGNTIISWNIPSTLEFEIPDIGGVVQCIDK